MIGAGIPILVTVVSSLLWLDPTLGLYLAGMWDVLDLPLLVLWPSRIMLLPGRRSHGLLSIALAVSVSTIVNTIWFLLLGAVGRGLMRGFQAVRILLRSRNNV